jgi:hypothetical protein
MSCITSWKKHKKEAVVAVPHHPPLVFPSWLSSSDVKAYRRRPSWIITLTVLPLNTPEKKSARDLSSSASYGLPPFRPPPSASPISSSESTSTVKTSLPLNPTSSPSSTPKPQQTIILLNHVSSYANSPSSLFTLLLSITRSQGALLSGTSCRERSPSQ